MLEDMSRFLINVDGLNVVIRKVCKKDLDKIKNLIDSCFSNWHAYYAKRGLKNHEVYVAEVCNDVVGFIEFKVVNIGIDVGHIYYMCVRRDFRGRGIGRRLVEYCENVFKSRDVSAIIATTQEYNIPVINLFKKLGYLIVDWYTAYRILKNIGANIEDEYDLMWKIYDYDDLVLLKVLKQPS